jgi:hypothetical protein
MDTAGPAEYTLRTVRYGWSASDSKGEGRREEESGLNYCTGIIQKQKKNSSKRIRQENTVQYLGNGVD